MTSLAGVQVDARPAARALVDSVHAGDMSASMTLIDTMDRAELVSVLILLASVVDEGNPLQPPAPLNARQTTIDVITAAANMAAAVYRIEPGEIYGTARGNAPVAYARHVVCAIASWTGVNNTEIGRVMGRDRTTVLNSINQVDGSPELSDVAHRIMHRIEATRRKQ